MKPVTSFLGALALAAVGLGSGCGGHAQVYSVWEVDLLGSLSLRCRNIEHIGYGIHDDIIINHRESPPPALLVASRSRYLDGGQRRH